MKKWTVSNTRTWVCFCIVNLYLSGVKSKQSIACLFLCQSSWKHNTLQVEHCEDQIEEQRCERWPHSIKKIYNVYIIALLCSWMVPKVLADLLGRPKPATFSGGRTKLPTSVELETSKQCAEFKPNKCPHTLDLLRQALQHIFSWI